MTSLFRSESKPISYQFSIMVLVNSYQSSKIDFSVLIPATRSSFKQLSHRLSLSIKNRIFCEIGVKDSLITPTISKAQSRIRRSVKVS